MFFIFEGFKVTPLKCKHNFWLVRDPGVEGPLHVKPATASFLLLFGHLVVVSL